MDIIPRIKEVLDAEPNDVGLDKFLDDVRDSLATSNRQFIGFSVAAMIALATYHLVVYEGAKGLSLSSVQVPNMALFRRVFLVVPAALLAAVSSMGYLRRCQREVYDYLAISRYRVLGKAGLHELRLPSDHVLALSLLRLEGGVVGNVIAGTLVLVSVTAFVVAPAIYIVWAAVENLMLFGWTDGVTMAASVTAVVVTCSSLVVAFLAGHIKAN